MASDERDPAVRVHGLTRQFRRGGGGLVNANDNLSLSIPRGQVFGLLGPNGAGKTTLVSQLLGLLRPTSGSIRVEGIDVVADPDAVKAVAGFLPQTPLAMRRIEVHRALYYTGRLRGQADNDARRQAAGLIDELGLGDHADRQVGRLSGGLTRLVNFGMTLMGRPKLLVLDEPTNELDPHNRRLVWDVVSRRSRTEGTTVVLVTHNVLEAENSVHRVAVMNAGRIVALGTPGELKDQLGETARMELSVKGGDALTDVELAKLTTVGEVVPAGRDGSYLIHSEPDRVPELVEIITSGVGLTRVDDFRLSRPTLEDVYLRLPGRPDHPTSEVDTTGEPPPAAAVARQGERLSKRAKRLLTGFKYLWLERFLEIRDIWPWYLLFGLLMPAAMVFGLARIGNGLSDHNSLLYIVSGAAVFSVTTEGVAVLAQQIGAIRSEGMMLYFASLPITRTSFLAAMVLAKLLLIAPGLISPVVAANLFYGAGFTLSPAYLLVLPLTCLALSAVGLAIGTLFDSVDLITMITNVLTFVLLLAAPVLIPVDSLPVPLRVFGYLLPPTYAADSLRRALSGDLGPAFLLDVAVLAAMACLGLAMAGRWIRWRVA
jgi:ABC-2 type transport system permease protein